MLTYLVHVLRSFSRHKQQYYSATALLSIDHATPQRIIDNYSELCRKAQSHTPLEVITTWHSIACLTHEDIEDFATLSNRCFPDDYPDLCTFLIKTGQHYTKNPPQPKTETPTQATKAFYRALIKHYLTTPRKLYDETTWLNHKFNNETRTEFERYIFG